VAGVAVVITVLVLGYCTHEVLWRVRRVRRDLAALAGLAPELAAVQRRLQLVTSRSSARATGGR
jgi:hypothetical protein